MLQLRSICLDVPSKRWIFVVFFYCQSFFGRERIRSLLILSNGHDDQFELKIWADADKILTKLL